VGNAYGDLGQPGKKQELLERALRIQEAHYGPDHYEVAITGFNLAVRYENQGRRNEAKELLERVLYVFERHYGEDHQHSNMARKELARCCTTVA
jgi:tetratricopeptide (TPR) repeat protein